MILDSLPIDDRQVYTFFQETDENESSVTELTEDQALRWVIEHPQFRNTFCRRFLPEAKTVRSFYGLQHPFTSPNNKPGDIDLLLVDPGNPHLGISFECKRVKARSQDTAPPRINNVTAIRHGIKQANAYQSLGFHQSYLLILLLDDGRTLETPNVMFRYNKSTQLNAIYDIPLNESIHPDVGVVYIRINQMTGKSIEHSVSLGLCVDKQAGKLEQTPQMTNKIRSIL
jgi:hypothetical protein